MFFQLLDVYLKSLESIAQPSLTSLNVATHPLHLAEDVTTVRLNVPYLNGMYLHP